VKLLNGLLPPILLPSRNISAFHRQADFPYCCTYLGGTSGKKPLTSRAFGYNLMKRMRTVGARVCAGKPLQ
jgi:hypothetical protein